MLLFFVISLLFFSEIQTQHPSEFAFSTHGMVIVLDDGELWGAHMNPLNERRKYSLASTYTLLQALLTEKFPVIITKKSFCVLQLLRLWAEYAYSQNPVLLKELQDLTSKPDILSAFRMDPTAFQTLTDNVARTIKNIDSYTKTGIWQNIYSSEIQHQINTAYGFQLILAAYYNFMPNEWIIRDIGSNLVLLVPKKVYKNDKESGLWISKSKDVSNTPLTQILLEAIGDYPLIEHTLPKLFIPQEEYPNPQSVPAWSIYMHGHGKTGEYLTMESEELLTLLKNFNKKIDVKLLILNACSLKKEITDEFQKIIQTKFNDKEYNKFSGIYAFGGIIEHFTTTVQQNDAKKVVSFAGGRTIKISTSLADFNSFFNDVQSDKPINFEDTLNKVFLYKVNSDFYPQNIPLIRFPSNDFFTPLQAPALIASIGSVLTQTRDPQKPLNVNTFFKKQAAGRVCPELPKMILLYTFQIPFYLEIKKCNESAFPLFVSMIDTYIIRLKGVILEDFSEDDALEALKRQFKLNEMSTIYIIDEILIKNIDPLYPSQTKLTPAQQKIVLIKGDIAQDGYEPGLYYINSLGQPMMHSISNIKVGIPQQNHDVYAQFHQMFKDTEVFTSPKTDVAAKEIEESLLKKKSIQLQETIKSFSKDLAIVATLL